MLIICPRCSTKFNLSEKMASPLRKAKCSFCGDIFVLADGMSDTAFDSLSMKSELPDSDSLVKSILDEGAGYDLDSVKPKKRNKFLPIIAGAILLLVVLLGTLIHLGIINIESSLVEFGPETMEDTTEQVATNATSQNATSMIPGDDFHLKDIIFQDTNQYFVNNEKLGRLFVIEGKVVNNYKVPKELIQIEASLLDEAGTAVATKQQFCGITLTMFQLQVLSEADLNKALSNNIEILANNLNIQPGGAVSFMIVFVNPPPNISTLFLKILEAKDSPTG